MSASSYRHQLFSNVVKTHHSVLSTQSKPMVSLHHATLELSPGGLRFRRHREYQSPERPRSHKPRGRVTSFSKGSMRNFRDKLMNLDLDPFIGQSKEAPTGNGFFLSLGYPAEYPVSKDTLHRHREKLSKQLRRTFGDSYLGAVWKLELQDCGAPHFHIITLFSCAMDTAEIREWTTDLWTETVGCYDLDFRRYGPNVVPLYGIAECLRSYMLKNLSLKFGDCLELGRIWGVWECKKGSMPFKEPELITLETPEEHAELLRRLKSAPDLYPSRMLQRLSTEWRGFGLLGNGEQLRRHVEGLSSIGW